MSRFIPVWSFALPLSLALGSASLAWAQLPTATMSSLYPPGGKQGTTVEVTVSGANLDDGEKLIFSHPGITALPKMTTPGDFSPQARKVPGQFLVTIAGDVPVGLYDVRHVGRFGATNPRVFAVGTLTEALEKGDNGSKEKAQEINQGTTITGKADANNFDFYAINLKAGERLLIDCQAQRLDSKMNASLILTSSDGRELARATDNEGLDPVLDFTAPSEGRYVLALYDFVFNGGPDYCYRLHVSSGPFIDFVFPPAGPAGSNQSYTLYGRNLPGGQPADGILLGTTPLQKLTVNIPLPGDDAARSSAAVIGPAYLRSMLLDSVLYKLASPQGESNSVVIGIAQAPVIAEVEPNNIPAQAQKISIPCEVAGQFYPQRDEDWFTFEAKKGEVWMLDVISHRLGRDSDPMLLIQKVTKNEQGEEKVADVAYVDDPQERNNRIGDEFDLSTDDPSYKLVAPDDATYRVMVRDQFGDGRKDPRFVYRFVVRKPEPDFRLAVFPDLPTTGKQDMQVITDTFVVPRGGTAILKVNADRRDDFEGEIEINVEGLPAGVTCGGAILGGKVENSTLVIAANNSAAAWSGSIRIVAKATINGQVKSRAASPGTVVWGVQNKQNEIARSRAMRDLVLCVADKEPAPVFMQFGDGNVIENSLGGKLELPLTLVRNGQLKDPLKLALFGFQKDIKAKDLSLDNSKNDGIIEIELNNQNLKPGVYSFCVKGDSKMSYARNPEQVAGLEAEQKELNDALQALAEKQKLATAARDQSAKTVQEAKTLVQQTEAQRNALQAEDPARKDAEAKLVDATAKLKQAEEALPVAEKMVQELTEKVKVGTALKQPLEQRLGDAKKNAQPKDVNVSFLSTVIKLRLHAAPIKWELPPQIGAIKAGEKGELTVQIIRMFNCKDPVEITLDPPAGVPGLTPAKVTIAADQTSGKLEYTPQKNAPVGSHNFTLKAKGKFGNANFEIAGQAAVQVDAAP